MQELDVAKVLEVVGLMQAHKIEVDGLRKEMEDLRKERDDLRKRLDDSQQTIIELMASSKEELDKVRQEAASLRFELEEAKSLQTEIKVCKIQPSRHKISEATHTMVQAMLPSIGRINLVGHDQGVAVYEDPAQKIIENWLLERALGREGVKLCGSQVIFPSGNPQTYVKKPKIINVSLPCSKHFHEVSGTPGDFVFELGESVAVVELKVGQLIQAHCDQVILESLAYVQHTKPEIKLTKIIPIIAEARLVTVGTQSNLRVWFHKGKFEEMPDSKCPQVSFAAADDDDCWNIEVNSQECVELTTKTKESSTDSKCRTPTTATSQPSSRTTSPHGTNNASDDVPPTKQTQTKKNG
eukprot:PhF_6_TR18056/c0_g1_i1/m.26907